MNSSRADSRTLQDAAEHVALSQDLREAAVGAARHVGDLLRTGFTAPGLSESKDGRHDLVTEYDRQAERMIRSKILDAYPESRIVGEEGGDLGRGELVWYVDPIDGTSNFAGGVPFFCVSIGVECCGELIAGVVYDPLRDEMFAADLTGATRNGSALVSSRALRDADAVLATDYPDPRQRGLDLDGRRETDSFGDLLHSFRTVRRLGSGALTLAYVAAGQLDATLGVNAKPWDVAGGIMLVNAAGGHFRSAASSPQRSPDAPVWACEAYVATVGNFDLESSRLVPILERLHV